MADGRRSHMLMKISDAVIGLGRGSVETFTQGLLSVVHYGKKRELPPITDSLLLEPAVFLAQKIRRGEVSSLSVVLAYIERMNEVDPVINAVVERRFSEALRDAAYADELVKSGAMSEELLARDLPLLGVPFTSKEACLVKGLSSTCGLVCRKGMKAVEDCQAVNLLRNAGAIPLAVTNTSEICMWWETYNNLHGQTNNPYDTTRTVGGSSGGEAALIAAAGSLVGIGTDLGASIRLPCFFSGIFGHKPSAGLVPHGRQFPPVLSEVIPYVVTGPMTRYAKDLRLLLKVLAGPEASVRLRLDSQVPLQSIKVLYMVDDGGQPARSPVHPELKFNLERVVDWLKEIGVVVEEVNLYNFKHAFLIWCSLLSEVKDQTISGLMAGDVKPDSEVNPLHQEMWKWFSGKSDYTFPTIFNACMQDHVAPLLKKPFEIINKRGVELKKEMDELLRGDTVFMCPTFPTPAQHHGQMIVSPFNVGYSVVFNALGLPATHCPLGLTKAGLPIGIQIASAHGNDRLLLSMAEQIEQKFHGWIRPS